MSVEIPDAEWRAYDVDAASLAGAAAAIARMREAAKTEWFAGYEYTASRGRLVSAAVTVRTVVTMPRWTGEAPARAAEKQEWRRFLSALRAHEQGHLALVAQHLADADMRLVGTSIAAVRTRWKQLLAALKAASDAYDRTTDHGRRQGAWIDVGVIAA
jgi:predicted secreted Zn-dependent protease